MSKVICFALLLFTFSFVVAQENCYNGIDDNGNGLTDLNDPECACFGIVTQYIDVSEKIPNNDFETMDCCPHAISMVSSCLTNWVAPTHGTPDYQNTCNFVMAAAYQGDIHPFPSGNGVVGMICAPQWREYITACLTSPIEAGKSYEFRIKVAFTPLLMSSNYPLAPNPPGYPAVTFSLFGNTTNCGGLDLNGTTCPPVLSNLWSEVSSMIVVPSNIWTTYIMRFTPGADILSITFGPGCNVPENYRTAPITPYFWIDDMALYEIEDGGELEADYSGHPCQGNLILTASAEPQGGAYQWYRDGVAIEGATDQILYLDSDDYAPGYYQVRYTLGNDCMVEGFDLSWVLPEPLTEEISFCPGETVVCGGQSYNQPGTYEVRITRQDGCDSVVTCVLNMLPDSPPSTQHVSICDGDFINVCGEIYDDSGEFQVRCTNAFGCDSTINVQLYRLNPQAVIIDPGAMDCDTAVYSLLDGSTSIINPDPNGFTEFTWAGPSNGIVGRNDTPQINVQEPGTYCLILTHFSNGISCSDQQCISIERPFTFPQAPVLPPISDICVGDTLVIRVDSASFQSNHTYTWSHSGLVKTNESAGQIRVTAPQSGIFEVCVAANNECGSGDTACVAVRVLDADTTLLNRNTCNPNQNPRDTIRLQNAQGCDSLVIVLYQFSDSDTTHVQFWTCNAFEAGLDTAQYVSEFGCDSIVITQRDYVKPDTTLLETYRCDISIDYKDTIILNGLRCDSTIIVNYLAAPSDTLIFSEYVCNIQEAINDTLWLANRFGCDSVIYHIRTFIMTDSIFFNELTCDSTLAGIELIRHSNQFGCDSIHIIERTFSPYTFSEQFVSICGAGTPYTDTLLLNGTLCDSFVYTHYSFFPIDSVWLERITCDPQEAGVIVQQFQNQYGCDSIVTEQIRLESGNLIELFSNTCNPALSGVFTDSLINQYGCDSIRIHHVQYIPLDTLYLLENTCNPNEEGQFVFRYVVRESCDSIVIISKVALPLDTVYMEQVECDRLLATTDSTRLVNQFGCDSLVIHRRLPDTSNVVVDLGMDRIVREGEPVDISANIMGSFANLLWNPTPDGNCNSCLTQQYTLFSDTQITLNVWSAHGCINSDSISIRLIRNDRVFIPDAFTPDNDGINDRFTVFGGPRLKLIKALSVFDRWGNMVYLGENLPPNDPRYGWDGSFSGTNMDPAVFAFVAIVEFEDGTEKTFFGEVSLLR